MRVSHAVVAATVVALLATSGVACNDPTRPAGGRIEVAVTSTGSDVDPDGYLVRIDSRLATRVTVSSTTAFVLGPGEHSITLDDLASNCTVDGDNPRTVSVVAEATISARFRIACVSRTGSIRLTIRTTGGRPDPDGYRVSVDGGPAREVAANGELLLTDIHEGSHRITLSDVASNCVLGAHERTVAVFFASTSQSEFTVFCPGTGTLKVTTVTTGVDLDPDGYIVNAYSTDYYYGPWYNANVATNGSVSISDVQPGTYYLSVDGRAANCELPASNTLDIEILDGTETAVTLSIVCAGKSTLTITSATTGADPDLDGYFVDVNSRSDSRNSRRVTAPANGSVSLPDIVAGSYSLDVSGWAPNCELVGPNHRDVSVATGSTTSVSLNVACLAARRLAFADGASANIYTIKSNGTELARLTAGAGSNEEPAWSPDASKLAFVSNRDGVFRIYLMNADGSDQRPLTAEGQTVRQPAWSPDGQKIAFVSGSGAGADIYVMKTDGTNVVRLTTTTGFDGDPAWSPDGGKIAFRSDRSGSPELYVMNADGSGVTRLTTTAVDEGEPAWSPDGTRIVYAGKQCDFYYGCYSDLYIMGADGSGVWQLTAGAIDYSPAWSPDGAWIAYVTSTCDHDPRCKNRLSMVKADGKGGGTIWEGHVSHPSWRP